MPSPATTMDTNATDRTAHTTTVSAGGASRTAGSRAHVRYQDLRAEVFMDGVPVGAGEELPSLYGSLFSTMEAFTIWDEATPTGACILDEPRHVLLFILKGDTIDVLNKMIDISPDDVRRVCSAIFRAVPTARRIRLEVMFPPEELPLPKRVTHWTDHMVIDIRSSGRDCRTWLGSSTRRTIRKHENRLRKRFGSMHTEVFPAGDKSRQLFETFLRWKTDRFKSRGRTTFWEERPELVERFIKLAERRGEAHVTYIDDRPAAIVFAFLVGSAVYAFHASFDTAYEPYGLGLLTLHKASCHAAERGADSFNLLWGNAEYKGRLGARPVRATSLSVFRNRAAQLYHWRETEVIARKALKRRLVAGYWQARRRTGRILRRISPRLHSLVT